MATIALIIYALWAGTAFVLRSLIQRHRTGDTGLRSGGPPGSLQWWTRILFVTALAIGVLAAILELADVIDPVGALDSPLVQGLGTLVALVGVAATFATQLAMGDSWRLGVDPNEDTRLVTTGPFAVVRNPIFATVTITASGVALMVPNAIALAGIAVLAAAVELQVRAVEEPYLQVTHGDHYQHYAAQVGRFIPKLRR